MRIHAKIAVAAALLVLTSRAALAHGDVRFAFSIGLPVAPLYVPPPRAYYDAPPRAYYDAPPRAYYAPPPAYYEPAPDVSIYYGPSYRHYRERHRWRRDRDDEDDDD